MLGLIKKDFSIIKANFKAGAIIFIVYLIMAIQGNLDITFILPLISVILFISTFSYDEFNNWNSYVSSLPNGRKNAVKAKYVGSILFTIILSILAFIISIVISYIKTNAINIEEITAGLMGTMLAVVIIISIMYPIIFKFGSTNGRLILFAVVFGVSGIIAVISNFVDMSFFIKGINMLESYSYIKIPLISLILLMTSYFISNKIYQNKEF